MKRISLSIALLVSACAGQSFEVASIRANSTGDNHSDFSVLGNDGARLATKNVSLLTLIQRAFNLHQYQISGPEWMKDQRFDINAELPSSVAREQVAPALRSLLTERFELAFHHETKEQSVYVLGVGKGGSKLKATENSEGSSGTWQTSNQYKAQNENLAHFCEVLSRQLGRAVIDQTGLEGGYDFVLDYDQQDSMSLFVSIESKLGLKLETKKAPVELMVIDRIRKTPTEN